MIQVNAQDIALLHEIIDCILRGKPARRYHAPANAQETEFDGLAQAIDRLVDEYETLSRFAEALSRGDLEAEPPRGWMLALQSMKNLHASLRHLTWKTQQVARGDFTQRVDFMGEFSVSFNWMVEQLSANRDALLQKNAELETASRTDPLTGLPNRRGANEVFAREFLRADRTQRTNAVLVVDIDHFKRINDTFGHDAGDAVLVNVAHTLSGGVRKIDLCARWGGEEFLVLLTETDLVAALEVAERLRSRVIALRTRFNDTDIGATISIGLALCQKGEGVDSCIGRSDGCLYRAKEAGRNQIWYQDGADASPQAYTNAR
ncbi:MAG: diguanylate cyclase [Candidatus Hydrogenedentes bacterium]|nr:diguanylate cyclase [Candidatus Hydrogenedentota bacterium]